MYPVMPTVGYNLVVADKQKSVYMKACRSIGRIFHWEGCTRGPISIEVITEHMYDLCRDSFSQEWVCGRFACVLDAFLWNLKNAS